MSVFSAHVAVHELPSACNNEPNSPRELLPPFPAEWPGYWSLWWVELLQASHLISTEQAGAEVSEASAAMSVRNKCLPCLPHRDRSDETPHWSWFLAFFSPAQYTSNQTDGPDPAHAVAGHLCLPLLCRSMWGETCWAGKSEEAFGSAKTSVLANCGGRYSQTYQAWVLQGLLGRYWAICIDTALDIPTENPLLSWQKEGGDPLYCASSQQYVDNHI